MGTGGADLVRRADALLTRAVDAVAPIESVTARVVDDAPPRRPDPTPSLAGQAPPPVQDLAPELGATLDVIHARLYGRAGTMLLRADRAVTRHLLDAFA
jgi:hypothetical protein